jgi:hypothetical protein
MKTMKNLDRDSPFSKRIPGECSWGTLLPRVVYTVGRVYMRSPTYAVQLKCVKS